MTRIVQFLNTEDLIDICCPSKSRSTVVDDDDLKDKDMDVGAPFVIIPHHFDPDDEPIELKHDPSTQALMKQLTQVRDDLKKIQNLASKDKSQLNSMLLLLRGEVNSKKNKDGTTKKSPLRHLQLQRFRNSKKTADV